MRIYRPMATRRDRLADAVREEIRTLLKAQKDLVKDQDGMGYIELSRRAAEPYRRVQKFMSGGMPYPPLEFLDHLARALGHTLLDLLKGHVKPVKRLPIVRSDVLAVAESLSPKSEAAVRVVASFVKGVEQAVQAGEQLDGLMLVPKPEGAGKPPKRGTRPK